MAHTSSVEQLFERYGPAYRWYATVTVMLGTLSVVLAATIINVAIPAIMARFELAPDEVQWLATGFLAAMTVGMLLNAWAVARFGARLAFVIAMGFFVVASLAGGLSQSFGLLIAARVVQGVAAGLIQPQAMVAIFRVFPLERRGTAVGIYGMGVILGPAVAPALGGFLVDAVSWRAVFFIVLPGCLIAVFMAWCFLPGREQARRAVLDWRGLLLLSAGLVATLWALASGARRGWLEPVLLCALIGGPALLVGFALWQRRCRDPLFDPRVFAAPGFAAGFVLSLVMGAGLFASTYLMPLYFQQVAGVSASTAGTMLVPAGLTMALVFPFSGHFTDRVSLSIPVAAGLLLFGVSMLLMLGAGPASGIVSLIGWAALGRLGIGLMMPPVTAGSLAALPATRIDRGSGMINFGRQLGGALGVNLTAVLAQTASGFYRRGHPQAGVARVFEAGFDFAFVALAIVSVMALWAVRRLPRD